MSCTCCTPAPCTGPSVFSEIISANGDWDGSDGDKAAAIGRAVGNLPAYTGDFTEGGAAGQVAFTGGSCFVQVARYKYAVPPSPSCYLRFKWKQRFTPDVGSPVDTDHDETWEGTGTPCFPAGFDWDDKTTWDYFPTAGGFYEISASASAGVTSTADDAWTCVPGAEPTGQRLPGDASGLSDGVEHLGDTPPD